MKNCLKKCAVLLLVAAVLLGGAPAFASGEYTTYVNDDVCFTMEYPVGYSVSEDYVNSVFISNGDDFHFSAEYAYQTITSHSFVYSAADFAARIDDNVTELADWVGVASVDVKSEDVGQLSGIQCIVYTYETRMDDEPYYGTLVLFDSLSGFGCYCVGALIRTGSADSNHYIEQVAHMVDSFRVTGACMPDDYSVYAYDGVTGHIQFVQQPAAISDIKQRDTGNICIYPVEHVFTDANIVIHKTVYDESRDVETVLDGLCSYYFSNKSNAAYATEIELLQVGRYDMYCREVTYTDEGTDLTTDEFIFTHDGNYWEVYATYAPEYEDALYGPLVDLLCSLRLGEETSAPASGSSSGSSSSGSSVTGGGSSGSTGGLTLSGEDSASAPVARTWSVNEQIDQITAATKAVAGYYVSDYMEPLASATDVDNDGVWEFLEVYETKNDATGSTTVRYAAWAMQEGGPVLLASDALFLEVGGNSGAIGIAKRDGVCYLTVSTESPDGDSFHNTWRYIPWTGASLGSDVTEMTADGSYFADGGTYTVNGAAVSQSDFEAAQAAFSEMFHMDIVEGHGNGNVMTLDVADQWDFDL